MPEIIFNGPAGRLEGRYYHAKSSAPRLALVLHPDPRYGGTMNNRIVHTLYTAFARQGFSTLRINFRGVGRSQGSYDRGEGELSDAAAALDWLQANNPNAAQAWVAGFSFGAWIGMQVLMRRPDIHRFIAIAPPASLYDFTFLAPCPSSGLIIHGAEDNIVPEASVRKLADRITQQRGPDAVDYRVLPGAGHFFQDQAEIVGAHVAEYIRRESAALADVAE